MGMKTKIIVPFLVFLTILASCEKEIAKEPSNLVEKDKMVDIMYDLLILESIRVQNPSSLDSFKINSNDYIYKKYKIDSIQFAQSNIYYAADYKEYKKMFEQLKTRLDKNKTVTEAAIKVEKKKALLLEKAKKKLEAKRVADSIKKVKLEIKIKKEADSIKKIKAIKKTDSLKKLKKKKSVL
jgi:hypothetical protein